MGYSARYHVASLAAVFLALAVGILIGSEFGADILSGATEDLEQSLTEDLDQAQAQIEDVQGDLDREREFSQAAFPALVDGRLRGRRVMVLGLGGLSDELRDDIRATLEPTGARVGEFAILREPPDYGALAQAAGARRYRRLERETEVQGRFARDVGEALVRGRPLYEQTRRALMANFSGSPGRVDGLVVVRQPPPDLEAGSEAQSSRLEVGILEGASAAGAPLVGVERSADEESSIAFFDARGMSSVDNLDQAAGRVALAFALRGAAGSFGVKETADGLVPDLLAPPPRSDR
jgi:hypothetical protein